MKPNDRDKGLLEDMLKACDEATGFIGELTEEEFAGNRLLCLAIERCLELVGEAAGRVSKSFQDAHPGIPWQDIRGQRNILAHDYGNIEYEQLYKTVTQDAPILAATLRQILSDNPGVRESRQRYGMRPLTSSPG